MTSAQFALAVGADSRWIRNARRTVPRSVRDDAHDAHDAQRLGLVHELHTSLGIGLREAARMADEALAADPGAQLAEVAANGARTVFVTIDLVRTRHLHALRLARAMQLPEPERHGRPATGYRPMVEEVKRRARRHGDLNTLRLNARRPPGDRLAALGPLADLMVGLANAGVRFVVIGDVAAALFGALRRPATVDVIYQPADEDSLGALACCLDKWAAAPCGAPRGEHVTFDARLLDAAGTLALDTPNGAVNLVTRLEPIGDHDAVLAHADHELGFAVLGLAAQMVVQRHGGRTRNRELLFELRELQRERERERLRRAYSRSIASSCGATSVA